MVRANLCNASTAVEKGALLLEHLSLRTGHNMPNCVTGVVVFCDRSLFSQPPENDGLVSIEMRGYVQARQATRLSTMKKWVASTTWNPVPGGLTSDDEYISNMRRFEDPNDEWTRFPVFGSIGANNTGRLMERVARQVACLLENYLLHSIVSCNGISLMDAVLAGGIAGGIRGRFAGHKADGVVRYHKSAPALFLAFCFRRIIIEQGLALLRIIIIICTRPGARVSRACHPPRAAHRRAAPKLPAPLAPKLSVINR